MCTMIQKRNMRSLIQIIHLAEHNLLFVLTNTARIHKALMGNNLPASLSRQHLGMHWMGEQIPDQEIHAQDVFGNGGNSSINLFILIFSNLFERNISHVPVFEPKSMPTCYV